MKKALLLILTLGFFYLGQSQNLTKLKDLLAAKKYDEAGKILEEFISNPKYQKNSELYYLKAKMYSDLSIDANVSGKYPNAAEISLDNFKKAYEMDANKTQVTMTLEGPQSLYNLYVNPYNRGIKEFNEKKYDQSLKSLQSADVAGRFIFEKGLGLYAVDTNLTFLIGNAAALSEKEDLAMSYYQKLADISVADADYSFIYKNLMRYHFNKDNIAEFEKTRAKGIKLYPNEEYFTYDEVVFINDMQDKEKRIQRLEAKLSTDPNNLDILSILTSTLFERLFQHDPAFYQTEAEYDIAEAKLVDLYQKMEALSPKEATITFNIGILYVNRAYKVEDSINAINSRIRKFNDNAKPDKTGKKPTAPKEWSTERDQLRAKQIVLFEKALPFLLKAQPLMVQNLSDKQTGQLYKKLVSILIDIYGSKRQAAKLPADKTKFEKEEEKWNSEYDRLRGLGI